MRRVPDIIWEIAFDQHGVFSAAQAVEAGVRAQELPKLAAIGAIHRIYRGVYRVDAYPEFTGVEVGAFRPWQLAAAALWPKGTTGILGRSTALQISGTSNFRTDAPRIDVIVPHAFRITRAVPPELRIIHADIESQDTKVWAGGVRVTKLRRTLRDCVGTIEQRYIAEALVTGRRRWPAELPFDEACDIARLIHAEQIIPELDVQGGGAR